jgi:hypothetical protein
MACAGPPLLLFMFDLLTSGSRSHAPVPEGLVWFTILACNFFGLALFQRHSHKQPVGFTRSLLFIVVLLGIEFVEHSIFVLLSGALPSH